MTIGIKCSEKTSAVILGILSSKGIKVDMSSSIYLVEKGMELPSDVVAVVFETENIPVLMSFLDLLTDKKDNNKQMIVGKRNDKYELISYKRIIYFEAQGNDVYCFDGKLKYFINYKLYEIENSLMDKGFIRINKSTVVNILHIEEVIPWFGSRFLIKLSDNLEMEVSRSYSKTFKDYIGL